METSERNEAVLRARIGGDTLQEIADRYDLSIEGARMIVIREGRRQIDDLELRLLANTKTHDVEAFLIPDHGGPDFDAAMSYFQWAMRELAERGVEVRVHYRPVAEGIAFGVEDVTHSKEKSA